MTNSELTILTLIAQKPRHGYEIEQVVEQRGMRQWTEIGFSSIYYLLEKLHKRGWLTCRLESGDGPGPKRKVYRLTSSGRLKWRKAATDALSNAHRSFRLLELGLANLPQIDNDQAQELLRQYLSSLQQRNDAMVKRWNQARRQSRGQLPLHIEALFDLNDSLNKAEMAWITKFIDKLKITDTHHVEAEQC